jgi:hypothetical protein
MIPPTQADENPARDSRQVKIIGIAADDYRRCDKGSSLNIDSARPEYFFRIAAGLFRYETISV